MNAEDQKVGAVDQRVSAADQRLDQHDARLADLDKTSREALDRATAAGKLAEGKFLYSMVLSDDSVKFPVDGSQLSPEAQTRLMDFVHEAEDRQQERLSRDPGPHRRHRRQDAATCGSAKQRAEAVRLFMNQQGVPLNRMSTISYGQTRRSPQQHPRRPGPEPPRGGDRACPKAVVVRALCRRAPASREQRVWPPPSGAGLSWSSASRERQQVRPAPLAGAEHARAPGHEQDRGRAPARRGRPRGAKPTSHMIASRTAARPLPSSPSLCTQSPFQTMTPCARPRSPARRLRPAGPCAARPAAAAPCRRRRRRRRPRRSPRRRGRRRSAPG